MEVLKLIIKKYPWVIIAPLIGGIILVGVSTAYTMYRAFSYTPPAIPKATEENKHVPESRPTLDRYAVISQRDLFASALSGVEERVEAKQDKVRAAPTVSFKLMGTVVVSPGISAAIIEDPATREQELFHENDMVHGVKIVRILRNKVIVDKDGYEEVVEVVEEPPKTSSTPPVRQRRIRRIPVRKPVKVVPSSDDEDEPIETPE